ncbi:MAG: ABC transporter ATP-binding protein [Alphaproteobacteria bacterium]|nr:ABC transporter ATP-binding protein [Alphaproteobacteria bacterium]
MTGVRIEADRVSVHLPVFNINSLSLKKNLLRLGTNGRIHAGSKHLVIEALRSISFVFEEGDRVGIVGLNGAGKTTLLRTIAGIFRPTGGRLDVVGRVVPLLMVGAGMYDDASGYENIRSCALQHGMSVPEIEAKIDEIAEFTALGTYLSLPLYTYSAGMRMRLSYAVATAIESDILVLDEVIGAGDAVFAQTCAQRFSALLGRTRIIVLATHDSGSIRRYCNKALLLREGQVTDFGPTEGVLKTYERTIAQMA